MQSEHKNNELYYEQMEWGTWCDDYHLYEKRIEDSNTQIELVRFRGGHGVVEEVIEIDRIWECAFIMNINGKTIRSIPFFDNVDELREKWEQKN